MLLENCTSMVFRGKILQTMEILQLFIKHHHHNKKKWFVQYFGATFPPVSAVYFVFKAKQKWLHREHTLIHLHADISTELKVPQRPGYTRNEVVCITWMKYQEDLYLVWTATLIIIFDTVNAGDDRWWASSN